MLASRMDDLAPAVDDRPGAGLDPARMPGHWLLARMGKRVLRPGGLELTRAMLEALDLGPADQVVELAPGLGVSTRLALARRPASYTGIERDEAAVNAVRRLLDDPRDSCRVGNAMATGLADGAATAVYGEAMLTMQTAAQKRRIVREAHRILSPGGRYGIHELSLLPDELAVELRELIGAELSAAIHVGARPLTAGEWRALLEAEGFEIETVASAPMHLLEPARLVRDEGVRGAARLAMNILRNPVARRRVREMRRVFRKHQQQLGAVMLVARKAGAAVAPEPGELS
jgi:SAM-dependent methyltransferase